MEAAALDAELAAGRLTIPSPASEMVRASVSALSPPADEKIPLAPGNLTALSRQVLIWAE